MRAETETSANQGRQCVFEYKNSSINSSEYNPRMGEIWWASQEIFANGSTGVPACCVLST